MLTAAMLANIYMLARVTRARAAALIPQHIYEGGVCMLAQVMRALGEPSAVMRPVLEAALRFEGPARRDVLPTYLLTLTHYDSLLNTHRASAAPTYY